MKSLGRAPAFSAALIVLVGLSYAAESEAREKRDGINFGLGLKSLDESSFNPNGSQSSGANEKNVTVTRHVSPYLGYAFGKQLNLGVSFLFENKESEDRFKLTETNQDFQAKRSSSIRAGSLFARFQFAGFMYFEGGFGGYEVRESSENVLKTLSSDGTFTGQNESSSRQGVGPGYHLAVGSELSITNGFFFSGAYVFRNFTTFAKDGDTLGSKKTTMQKNELTFGLSYYQG